MRRRLRLLFALVVVLTLTMLFLHTRPQRDGEHAAQAIDALRLSFDPLPKSLTGTTASLGLLLLGSWLTGRLFKSIRLPKISGYLVFGLVVGPEALGVVTDEHLPSLKLVESLAIALIALTAGGEIEIAFLMRSLRLIASVAVAQLTVVLIAVFTTAYALAPTIGLTGDSRFIASLIVSTIATAASPAVFIAIMNELGAEGKAVSTALSVMVLKDLTLIVLFTGVLWFSSATLRSSPNDSRGVLPAPTTAQAMAEANLDTIAPPTQPATASMSAIAQGLGVHLLESLIAGVAFGFVFAWYMHFIRAHLAIFVVCASLSIALVSDALRFEALIVALVAGLLMRNVWRERVGPFFHTMEDLSLPVYCVFFAVAGAKLDLHAIGSLWPAALALVAVRAAALWASTRLGCWVAGEGPPSRTWMWTSFLPQAGVSVALISIAVETFADQPFAAVLYSLTLAIIAIHELLGPIALKAGLRRLSSAGSEPHAELS